MFRGLAAFKSELKDFVDRVPRGGIVAAQRVAQGWFAEIVALTPVDTGFTRSEWKYSINTKPVNKPISNPRSKGPFPPPSIPQFSGFRPGDKLYIYNNVSWIVKLEEGWSQQAPRNFFSNSARRANYKLQQEFDRIR